MTFNGKDPKMLLAEAIACYRGLFQLAVTLQKSYSGR